MLNAQIERQFDKLAVVAPFENEVLDAAFDTGETVIVDAHVAQGVRGRAPVRINAPRLVAKIHARNAELAHRFLLARREIALDPHERASPISS